MERGKTLAESRGEMRRAIENVDAACRVPILFQGSNSEDIAAGIDKIIAVIAPLDFHRIIQFWFIRRRWLAATPSWSNEVA